jgi:dienelactone hydrolase
MQHVNGAVSESALERGEPGPGNMHLERQRDNQQWLLDYLVRTTGRDRQFFYDGRKFPPGTRSYAMIPHQMERLGRHKETLARAADEHGHHETALDLFQRAAVDNHFAQHALPYDDHPEKLYLYDKLLACFDRVIALSPRPIERIEIPWEGHRLGALFYPAPTTGRAPTILHINGMDVPKEVFPHALANPYTARGFNALVVDGPGQGIANIRKTRITPDNHTQAMQAAIDYVVTRPDVDPDRIGVVGFSMGSYWSMRLAAADPRVKAVAGGAACYGPQLGIFQQASPHFKKQFMYMAGIHDEAEFDRFAEGFVLSDEHLAAVTCPVLMLVGEFDPLCPLTDAWRVYQKLSCPKEFWLSENDGHTPFQYPHLGGLEAFPVFSDWIRDVLARGLPAGHERKVVLHEDAGAGPYGPAVGGFWLPERLEEPTSQVGRR